MVRPLETEEVIQRLQKMLDKYAGIRPDFSGDSNIETCRSFLLKVDFPSKQRRSEHRKAKELLSSIYDNGNFAVLFFLFILTIPNYQWFLLDKRTIVPALKTWWKDVIVPGNLRDAAGMICARHFHSLLITEKEECKVSSLTQSISYRTNNKEATKLNINLRDLFRLLESKPGSDASVQLNYTVGGSPLPYIKFDLQQELGLSGSLELSAELCDAVSQTHLSYSATDVSHHK